MGLGVDRQLAQLWRGNGNKTRVLKRQESGRALLRPCDCSLSATVSIVYELVMGERRTLLLAREIQPR